MIVRSKKFLNQFGLFLVSLLTLYGIWALAGMGMFVLTIALAPFISAFETPALDYSIWVIITLLILFPGIKLLYSQRKAVNFSLWGMMRGYWFYLVPAYAGLLYTVFFIRSAVPGYQVVIVIELILSIWYFANFKKCVLKK